MDGIIRLTLFLFNMTNFVILDDWTIVLCESDSVQLHCESPAGFMNKAILSELMMEYCKKCIY